MLSVLLGLTGAVVYGAADFLGGLAARRVRAVTVAAVAAAVGLVPLVLGAAAVGATFSGPAVAAGIGAGVSGSVAVLLLYRALAVGPMSVLSPLTAVFAAVTPVAVALLGGTVLSLAASIALVVAVVAVVLVAAVRDTSGARVTAVGVVTAAVAGCGFGGIVLAYDAAPSDAGVATLLVGRLVQTVLLGAVVVVVAVRSGPVGPVESVESVRSSRPGGADHVAPSASAGRSAAGVPRGPRRSGTSRRSRWSNRQRWAGRTVVAVVACGVLDALANACIQAALHVGSGDAVLPVVSVLNALYPIGTVVLAGVVLRERLTRCSGPGSCSPSRRRSVWRWRSGCPAERVSGGAGVRRSGCPASVVGDEALAEGHRAVRGVPERGVEPEHLLVPLAHLHVDLRAPSGGQEPFELGHEGATEPGSLQVGTDRQVVHPAAVPVVARHADADDRPLVVTPGLLGDQEELGLLGDLPRDVTPRVVPRAQQPAGVPQGDDRLGVVGTEGTEHRGHPATLAAPWASTGARTRHLPVGVV